MQGSAEVRENEGCPVARLKCPMSLPSFMGPALFGDSVCALVVSGAGASKSCKMQHLGT